MTMVNRESFLAALESVSPGLAKREVLEQATCFIFCGGKVRTYNDEVSCDAPSHLDESLSGAVQAERLLNYLRKSPDEELNVTAKDGKLRLKGKMRMTKFDWFPDILLPLEDVEKPEVWKPLHPEFCEAVGVVQRCAEKDESEFARTCVHVHPKWVEAVSNTQLCRWKMRTEFSTPSLVRRSSIRHITYLGVTEFSETPNWLHFRNASDAVLSCRRSDAADFPPLAEWLKVEGTPVTIPPALGEIVERAATIMDGTEGDLIRVVMAKGVCKLVGMGATAEHTERKNTGYSGPDLDFLIPPELLVNLSEKHRECVVGEDKLQVNTGKLVYVTCLQVPQKEVVEAS